MIKDEASINVSPFTERSVEEDIDGDGVISNSIIKSLKKRSYYFGGASHIKAEPFLYPKGTEFLHTLRYLELGSEGEVKASRRIKELRYMKKHSFISVANLKSRYTNERLEKLDGMLPNPLWLGDRGYDNGFGWYVSGFIEGESGYLRPQTREESLFVWVVILQLVLQSIRLLVLLEKNQVEAIDLKANGTLRESFLARSNLSSGEIAQYFLRVGGGDEFRSNDEMIQKFLKEDGSLKNESFYKKSR